MGGSQTCEGQGCGEKDIKEQLICQNPNCLRSNKNICKEKCGRQSKTIKDSLVCSDCSSKEQDLKVESIVGGFEKQQLGGTIKKKVPVKVLPPVVEKPKERKGDAPCIKQIKEQLAPPKKKKAVDSDDDDAESEEEEVIVETKKEPLTNYNAVEDMDAFNCVKLIHSSGDDEKDVQISNAEK